MLFHDVETVGVGEAGILLHQGHDRFDDVGVLLVRGQVDDQIGCGQHFLIGAHGESVFSGIFPGLALFLNGRLPQGVRDVQAGIPKVQALVKALGTAAHDDDFLALQGCHAVELAWVHEPALGELFQLKSQGKGVEIIGAHKKSPYFYICYRCLSAPTMP